MRCNTTQSYFLLQTGNSMDKPLHISKTKPIPKNMPIVLNPAPVYMPIRIISSNFESLLDKKNTCRFIATHRPQVNKLFEPPQSKFNTVPTMLNKPQ